MKYIIGLIIYLFKTLNLKALQSKIQKQSHNTLYVALMHG